MIRRAPRCLSVRSLLLSVSLCAIPLHAQTLEVTPSHVMSDEVATIRATGLQPHERVTLQADLVDGAGAPWASAADFLADDAGTVDTAKQAPAKGSYRIVSAMGLVWSMMPAAKDVHGYRAPHDFGTQTIHFHLLENDKPIASTELEQTFQREGVRQVKLTGALHGTLFLPAAPGPHPGVLVVGGSEGGMPAPKAVWLASHGYAALALAYFHFPGLPDQLANIPLEYFGEALAWMKQNPEVAPGQLAVMGTSRGGELALQLGSMYPDLRAVVAYVPANVRYPSCCSRDFAAAWTWKGQGLAFVRPGGRGQVDSGSRESVAAAIPVELTHGPILVISGDSDGIWDSSGMTSAVLNRLKQSHFAYATVRLNYARAGHRAGNSAIVPTWTGGTVHPLSGQAENFGGTPEGNAQSSLDAIPKVLDFLQQSFATPPAK